jgi:phage minor structural protein
VSLLVLRLGEIDLKKKPIKPKLYLCRPNKKIIASLTEAYGISYNQKLGALNELNFSIPFFVDRHHQLIKNPHIDIIRGRYLVKLILGNYEEYFIITKLNKIADNDDRLEVNTLSLGYELNDKILREYTGESKNATQLLEDVLVDTHWKVGYVDSEFDLKYRTLDVSSNTVLEVVFDIAKTFNALVVWDTINRTVNFYKPDAIGLERGFRIKYGKYLESLNQEDNAEEIVTRLKLYGKDNMSIHEVNVTGTSYIEDFSYFMYPFKRDENRNVISHSDYMSDELCHAILDYNEKLERHKGTFQSLLLQRRAKEEILTQKKNELFDLNVVMKQILDERDIANTLGQDTTQIIIDMNNQQALIDAKENEILQIEAEIQDIDNQINALKEDLKIENNFTPELIAERSQFIIEKEWQDENITNPDDLLKEGIKVFNELKQQKITVTVDVVNFLSMLTEQRNWDKLNLGDIVYIDHERLGVSYTAKITEIDYDFENNSISITISNVKDLYANKDKFLEMLYTSYGTSTQVSIDSWKWDLSLENHGKINEIINNIWDANKQAVEAGKNQVVSLSDRGLIIRSHDDPNTYLVGLNSIIAITSDGGNTWKQAITPFGIVGERIYGKIFMGVNLAIEDEDGVIKFQGSKGTIYDRSGNEVMWLGLVEENPDCFGLKFETPITQVEVTSCEGFAISRRTNGTSGIDWEKIFWANQLDGTLYSKDLVAQNLKIVNDIGEEILNAETHQFNIGDFQNITLDGKLTALEKIQIIKELERIYSNYQLLLTQASHHQRVARDSIYDTNYNSTTTIPSTTNLFETTGLTNAYNDLIDYMKNYLHITSNDPLVIDVTHPITEQTQDVDRYTFVLKFKTYYDEADKIRNAIENSLKYASLQMGEFYNNVSIGNYGLLAIRSDGKYRAFLNATHGLALQKWENNRWVNKVYASIGDSEFPDGTLIAEDLVAKRLKIYGRAGELLIDGDEGVLDLSKFKTIIGQLQADNVLTNVITADMGFISDLTVNKLVTLNTIGQDANYIKAMENYIQFIEGTYLGEGGQVTDSQGNPLYWTDYTKTQRTTENTGIPVMEQIYDEVVKMQLYFATGFDEEDPSVSIPVIEMGVGDAGATVEKGYIYKDTKQMVIEYYDTNSNKRRIRLREEGTVIDNENGNVVISGGGFLVTNANVQEGWDEQTYKTHGGFYVPANGNGVYNSFYYNGYYAARWKLDDDNYIIQTEDAVNWYVGNDSSTPLEEKVKFYIRFNEVDNKWRVGVKDDIVVPNDIYVGNRIIAMNGTIIIKANDSNYIQISPTGVKIVGSRIDLN